MLLWVSQHYLCAILQQHVLLYLYVADSTREVVDEIRSWNSTRTVEASKVTVVDVFVLRRLLRINLLPYDATNAADVLHPSACDGDFEW